MSDNEQVFLISLLVVFVFFYILRKIADKQGWEFLKGNFEKAPITYTKRYFSSPVKFYLILANFAVGSVLVYTDFFGHEYRISIVAIYVFVIPCYLAHMLRKIAIGNEKNN